MNHGINRDELKIIPYANVDALGDRVFMLMPLWDGEKWHQWVPHADGTLVEMKVIDLVYANYVSKKPASVDDLWIPFVDLVWQRACWPEIYFLLVALCGDFHKLATSVAKIKHFFHHRELIGDNSVAFFVATELEYIVVLARTVFDLLQETIATLWNGRVKLHDEKADALRKQNSLPKTFSKLVLNDQDIKSVEEIIEKYALTPVLAEEYIKYAPFFVALRTMRDKVIHGASGVSIVFVTEKGFCVSPKDRAFADFQIWNESHWYNENIVSLLPWIAHVIFGTINACSKIMEAFAIHVKFPPEIAPDYRVYIRDHASDALLDLVKVNNGEMVWWSNE